MFHGALRGFVLKGYVFVCVCVPDSWIPCAPLPLHSLVISPPPCSDALTVFLLVSVSSAVASVPRPPNLLPLQPSIPTSLFLAVHASQSTLSRSPTPTSSLPAVSPIFVSFLSAQPPSFFCTTPISSRMETHILLAAQSISQRVQQAPVINSTTMPAFIKSLPASSCYTQICCQEKTFQGGFTYSWFSKINNAWSPCKNTRWFVKCWHCEDVRSAPGSIFTLDSADFSSSSLSCSELTQLWLSALRETR